MSWCQRDKIRVARAFYKSAHSYEKHAVVQKDIGRELVAQLESLPTISYDRVFEIGCCTGFLTEQLCRNGRIGTIYVNDLVPEFCSGTCQRVEGLVDRVEAMPGDIEQLQLPGDIDLIISSATFQWIEDLGRLFARLRSHLRHGGWLVFSIFGPGTMQEITAITGQGLPYTPREELLRMVATHFTVHTVRQKTATLYFPDPRAVLRHVKQTGVGGIGGSFWTRRTLTNFEHQYQLRFGSTGGVPVSYNATLVMAKAGE